MTDHEPGNTDMDTDMADQPAWQPLLDRSIAAFHEGDFAAGRLACDRLLATHGLPGNVVTAAARNSVHYAPEIVEILPGWRERQLELPAPPAWTNLNPSIAARPGGGAIVLVRQANFRLEPPTTYVTTDGDAAFRTRYRVLELGDDLEPVGPSRELAVDIPDDGRAWPEVPDIEDLRLFRVGDRWLAGGSQSCRVPGRPRREVRFGLFGLDLDPEDPRIDSVRWLANGLSGVTEKNWMPIAGQSVPAFVYSSDPTAVVYLDPVTDRVGLVALHDAPPLAERFRGGSQAIPVADGYLAVVHEVAFWEHEARTYLHRLVRYDGEFRLTHCSHPFRFFGENLEFAAGVALMGDRLAISFGAGDEEAWIGDAPLAEVMDLLLPIGHLAPDGPEPAWMPEGLAHVLGIVEPEEIDLPDDWEGLQQRSIDAFYQERPDEGRLACDRLLNRPDAPDVSRLFARRNAIHYAPDLRDIVLGYREVDLDFEMPPGWFALNPTVAADPDGGLALLVRGSNWSAAHGGPHPASGEQGARSVYVALRLDDDLRVTADLGPLQDASPDEGDRFPPILGNEDYRLVRIGDRWLASASAWRLTPEGRPAIRMGLWDVDLSPQAPRVDNPRWLTDGAGGVQEKNWMPAVDGEDLVFVHTCGPTTVVRCDPDTGALTLAHVHPAPLMAANFRGGSQLVAHDGGWLALVHDIALTAEDRRVYLHRLVRFGPDFAITHVSHPFRFHGQPIEFAAGMARAGDRFVISFGVADDSAWVASVPADELTALLRPVEELAPGGPVELPLPAGLDAVLRRWVQREAAVPARGKEPPAAPSLAGIEPIPPRADGLPTIASVTLSGNSRDVIGDAIRSVAGWVDRCIVIDTGITDDTLEIAREAAGGRLSVAEFPWISDFAAARNFALAAAAVAGADWALNLDTDERIDLRGIDVRAVLAATAEDAVFMDHESGHYKKERLFRMPLRGEYVGPTHECWIGGARTTLPNAVFDELGKSEEQLEGKLERDREILERHTAEHPEDPRWWYYLGDTQANLGRHEDAIASFERCMALGGWDEEGGWSAYRASRILGDELKRWEDAEAMAARGVAIHPAMVDLYWAAGFAAFWGGRHQRAANWARAAIAINEQRGAGLIPERGGFKYPPAEREAPWDVLRHALRRLGDDAGADAADRRYQELRGMPAPREPRAAPEEPDPAGVVARATTGADLRAAPLDRLVERSVQAYWDGDLEAGRLACDLILSHPDAGPELRDNTRRNAVHYAPILARTVPGYASRRIDVPLPEGWFAFNPAIARHDGRLAMLVRCANYAMPGWVIAPGDDRYRSRYVAVALDADGRPSGDPYPMVDWTADDARRSANTEGLEDLRLVELDGRLLASGSSMRAAASGMDVVCLGLFDVSLEGRAIGNPRWLSDGSSGVHEKNWMPVVDGGRLRFIHTCGPTAVLDCDPETGVLDLAALHAAPAVAAGLRGGTPLAAHGGGWLALVHETAEWDRAAGRRTYLHRVVRFDRDLRITHLSHPFRFEGEEIEFAAGLVLEGDRALVSFGVGDREARLAALPLDALIAMLHDLPDLAPLGPVPGRPPAGIARLFPRRRSPAVAPFPAPGWPATWQEALDAPAFVVNLDRMPERLGPVLERIHEAGFSDVRRVRAVDGFDPVELADAWEALGTPPFAADEFRLADFPGHQGCLLSHVGIWRAMVAQGLPFAAVFEDDVLFHRWWHALAPERFAMTPADAEVVWLGAGIAEEDASGADVVQVPVGGLCGYLLTLAGAERLLRCVLDRPEGVTIVDQATQRCQRRMLAGLDPDGFRWYVWNGTERPDPPHGPFRRGGRIENAGLVHQGFLGSATQPPGVTVSDIAGEPFVAIDVGAHVGDVALAFARCPGFAVHAFEPVPELARALSEQARELPNLTVVNAAVAEVDGSVTLHVRDQGVHGTSSRYQWSERFERERAPSFSGIDHAFNRSLETRTLRLDGYLRERGIGIVHYLHIDAQGSDLSVLRGLGDRLGQVVCGVLEAPYDHRLKNYRDQPDTLLDVVAFLYDRGFVITRIVSNHYDGRSIAASEESDVHFLNPARIGEFARVRERLRASGHDGLLGSQPAVMDAIALRAAAATHR